MQAACLSEWIEIALNSPNSGEKQAQRTGKSQKSRGLKNVV
jgi:hypothetical protein